MRISDWSSDVCSSDLVDSYRAWLAPDGDIKAVMPVIGEPGAEPNIAILLPEGSVPWSGHSGSYAAPQVIAEIARHKTTLVFCNTRGLAELRSEEHTSELQSLMRISYAVFCLTNKTRKTHDFN